MKSSPASFSYRFDVTPTDRQRVREMVESTGVFHDHEIDVAVELVDERLAKGADSGYHFVFAERDGRTLGYACYGEIACTTGSYDLYWIAVDKACHGQGLGKLLLQEAERLIAREGGRRVYIETSNRAQYEPTRGFYLRCGYRIDAILEDFYAPGDGKVIYVKALPT